MFAKLSVKKHLRTPVVVHLQELASWLELFIPLLVRLGTSVFHFNGRTSRDDWEELYRGYQSEQGKTNSEFKFTALPYQNLHFAYLLTSIVDAFIKDVGLELKVMW